MVAYLLQEAVPVECMCTGKHVESLTQQSGVADLAPGVRINSDTPEGNVYVSLRGTVIPAHSLVADILNV